MRKQFVVLAMIFIALLTIPTANAFLDIITYDKEDKEYVISTWLGIDEQVRLKLISNTDYCDFDCKAEIQVIPDLDLTITNDNNFLWEFVNYDKLLMYDAFWLEDEVYKETVEEKIKKCTPYRTPNKNKTGTDGYGETCIVTTKEIEVDKTRQVQSKYYGKKLIKDKTYILILEGEKEYYTDVEWILTFNGYKLDEWAWWSGACLNRREYNVSITDDYFGTGDLINATFNITFDITNDFADYKGPHDFHAIFNNTEIHGFNSTPFDTTATSVWFNAWMDSTQSYNLSIYYNCRDTTPALNKSSAVFQPQTRFNFTSSNGTACRLKHNFDGDLGDICSKNDSTGNEVWGEQSWYYGGHNLTNETGGRSGNSYLADTGDFINVTLSGLPNITSQRIISFWVRTDNTAETVGFFNFNSINAEYLALSANTYSFLGCSDTGKGWEGPRVNDGQWQHLIVYYDVTDPEFRTCRIYYNGNQTLDGNWTPPTSNGAERNVIGRVDEMDDRTLGGEIDEFIIVDGLKLNNDTADLWYKGMFNLSTDALVRGSEEALITQNHLGFTNFTSEIVPETFNVNVTYENDTVNISTQLFYNNSYYDATQVGTGNIINFTASLTTPEIPDGLTTYNYSFVWVYTLTTETTTTYKNSSTYNQTVYSLYLDNCTEYDYQIFNFTYKDEENRSQIEMEHPTTFKALFQIGQVPHSYKNFSFNWYANITSYGVCISNYSSTSYIDAAIELYDADLYKPRTYYLLNESVANTTVKNISLFMINDTLAADPIKKIYVWDESGNGIEDVYVKIKKYYPEDNTWEIIAVGKTDSNGIIQVWLKDDEKYEFEFWQNYQLTDIKERNVFETDIYFKLLPPKEYAIYGLVQGINFSLSFNNVTNITTISYNFNEELNKTFNNTCLKVTKKSALLGDTAICYDCNESKLSGILECDTSTDTGSYIAYASVSFKTIDDKGNVIKMRKFPLNTLSFGKTLTGAWEHFSTEGVFAAIAIISVFVMIGLVAPHIALILGLVGFTFAAIMGLIHLTYAVVISIIVVGFILLFKMFPRGM